MLCTLAERNERKSVNLLTSGMSCGANLVPKLPVEPRTNGDDFHCFFESFVLVSVGW